MEFMSFFPHFVKSEPLLNLVEIPRSSRFVVNVVHVPITEQIIHNVEGDELSSSCEINPNGTGGIPAVIAVVVSDDDSNCGNTIAFRSFVANDVSWASLIPIVVILCNHSVSSDNFIKINPNGMVFFKQCVMHDVGHRKGFIRSFDDKLPLLALFLCLLLPKFACRHD